MKNIVILFLISISTLSFSQKNDSLMLKKISDEGLVNGKAYEWLDYLTNKIGGRLSGSPQAAAAVEYTYGAMKSIGVDTVYLMECMVPHWVRGEKEQGRITNSKMIGEQDVNICALGNSIGTPPEGLTAELIEVKNFDELKKLGKGGSIKGKIVFYNHPFDQTFVNTGNAYGEAVGYRWKGPSEAARYGAIATVVRSMSSTLDDNPHTGAMGYNDSLPKIPCCAVSTKGANLIEQLMKSDNKLKFFLKMNCQMMADVKSYNVIGEIRGSEHPEEIITVGGHLDSWDTGAGAHDDGTGCVQAIEVLRLFHALGIKPKRTIRAVMFMNEENGGRGGDKYFETAEKNKEKHLAAIESDGGGFSPKGFSSTMPDAQKEKVIKWAPLFEPYGVYEWKGKGGGADIDDLKKLGCALFGLSVDGQKYFDIHHTPGDTFDKVNRRELQMGADVMAMLIYLISEYGL